MSSHSIHELPPAPAGERPGVAASEPVPLSGGDQNLSDSRSELPPPPAGERPGVAAPESTLLSGGDQDRSEGETTPMAQAGGASDAYAALQKTCEGMLIALEKMRASQETVERMELDKVNPNHNISNLAQQIWTKLQEAPAEEEGCGLSPDSEGDKRSDIAATDEILAGNTVLRSNEWRSNVGVHVYQSYPGPSVYDPFRHYDYLQGDGYYKSYYPEEDLGYKPEFHINGNIKKPPNSVSGLIIRVSIDRHTLTLSSAALEVVQRLMANVDYFELLSIFLRYHALEWKEPEIFGSLSPRTGAPIDTICNQTIEANNSGQDLETTMSSILLDRVGTLAHCMRSFEFAKVGEEQKDGASTGVRCRRQTLRISHANEVLLLREKRYSVVLQPIQLQRPCGKFTLLLVSDSLGFRELTNCFSYHSHPSARATPWATHGILPAGLYTGISVFQLHLCAVIDAWEEDWSNTIVKIEDIVSIKFGVLSSDDKLREILLQTKQETSLAYFKVIKILGLFLDSVRASPKCLDELSWRVEETLQLDKCCRNSLYWKESERILSYNWDIVRRRQKDSADRITVQLQRTKDEVQSLLDGLFQVQSITEAQKSRTLNKYLFVFTFFTILFLPPTFVATFFGSSLFNSPSGGGGATPSTETTLDTASIRKQFWITFATISGSTYVTAGLMMLGTSVPGENWARIVRKGKAKAVALNRGLWKIKREIKFWGYRVAAQLRAVETAMATAKMKRVQRSKNGQDDASRGWKRFWHRKAAPQARPAETGKNVV